MNKIVDADCNTVIIILQSSSNKCIEIVIFGKIFSSIFRSIFYTSEWEFFFTSQNKLLPVLEADEPSIDQMGNVHLFGHHITGEYTAEDPTGMTQCIFSHDFPFKTKRI